MISHNVSSYTNCERCGYILYKRIVPKVSVLIFYLNVYWTHLKLQVISFKVWPMGISTVAPTFFSAEHSSTGSHFP